MTACLLSSGLLGQAARPFGVPRSINRGDFHDCREVEKDALTLAAEIQDRTFFMQLFSGADRIGAVWPSETPLTPLAVAWIDGYGTQVRPYAIFYSVNGHHTLKCRDDQRHLSELSGPGGNVLELKLTFGSAAIWHFSLIDPAFARVFVVTDIPLENVDGAELMEKVKQVLGLRAVLLFVRNDCWFYGYSSDSIPYILADSQKRITPGEYLKSKTMLCDGASGCRIVRSQE